MSERPCVNGEGPLPAVVANSKELKCLRDLARALDDAGADTARLAVRIHEILPAGFRFSEQLTVRLSFQGATFASPAFRQTAWILREALPLGEGLHGSLEVAYLAVSDEIQKDRAFLLEEKKLLRIAALKVAKRLSRETSSVPGGAPETGPRPEWQIILDLLRETDPNLWKRLLRKFLNHLSNVGAPAVNDLISRFDPGSGAERDRESWGSNQPLRKRDVSAFEGVFDDLLAVASVILSHDEITAMVKKWIRQDHVGFLALATEQRDLTLPQIADIVERIDEASREGEEALSATDALNVRVALTRRFLTERLPFIRVAKEYLGISMFARLLRRVIGPARSTGKLGGKASGLLLAEQILLQKGAGDPLVESIRFPRAWFLASDGLFEFVKHNSLEDTQSFKYSPPAEVRRSYPYLEQVFKHSFFPPELTTQLKVALDELGEGPLIVRSSSLLEDSEGTAFSGKYRSLFLANVGTPEARLSALQDAISEVYASVLGPDPIQYRRERGLLDFMEEMGILIQRVVGVRCGKFFLPAFAGVAFSHNEFRWSPRLRREDGILRVVAGLGTRAVDRVGDDYPTLISPGQPGLRVNADVSQAIRYAQRKVDVINLESGRFESVDFQELLGDVGDAYPLLEKIVSFSEDGTLRKPAGKLLDLRPEDLVITFAGLFEGTDFLKQMRAMMTLLERAMGGPVDVEFAHDGRNLYMLQCRPQSRAGDERLMPVPENVPPDRRIFTARKYVTTAQVRGIRHIVYVDGAAYAHLASENDMMAVGEAVGRLNGVLPPRSFILMGPGRWGSRGDILLGVRVTYSDISNSAMLVEVARRKGSYVPDLSFGTHFFQDLVESRIRYLALYPDDEGIVFNEAFLMGAPNALATILPEYAYLEEVLRVIDLDQAAPGFRLEVVMDGEKDRALAHLVDAPETGREDLGG
jgi:hypothetical protein